MVFAAGEQHRLKRDEERAQILQTTVSHQKNGGKDVFSWSVEQTPSSVPCNVCWMARSRTSGKRKT